MKIGWIDVLKRKYGETVYAEMARSILSEHHEVQTINPGFDPFRGYLYPALLFRLYRLKGAKDIWIRNFDSILTLPHDGTRGKNVAMFYHLDYSLQPSYLQPLWKTLEKTFYSHLRKVSAIVTISKYWQNHFRDRGYPAVYLIYNGFDIGQFHFHEQEIEAFKETYSLKSKPILYLGNCQAAKGVVEAYEELKDLDVHLVTSGRREADLPALNLNLGYRDYLRLLKAASVVVTMSKFKEGWNRTAHEALLCKTPVIGSGMGGMGELLEGGKQLVCADFRELREKAIYALDHPKLGEKGYDFVKQFTADRFNEDWLNLVKAVHERQ